MRKQVLYSFGSETDCLARRADHFHGFLQNYASDAEKACIGPVKMTPELKATRNFKGARALSRIDASGFLRSDVDAFFAYFTILVGRAHDRLAALRAERLTRPDHPPTLATYDGMIERIDASIRHIEDALAAFKAEIYPAMVEAIEETERHP